MNVSPKNLWDSCLQLIKENVTEQQFDTWFKPIVFESFNDETKLLVLRVPSSFVYEYIEEHYIDLLSRVLFSAFGQRIRLTYRVVVDSEHKKTQDIEADPAEAHATQTAKTWGAKQKTEEEPMLSIDSRYFIVLSILIALLIFLYIFKKYITSKSNDFSGFKTLQSQPQNETKSMNWLLKNQNSGVNIIYEKYLDRTNKLMLLSYENRRYLVIVGSSNVMLDSFGEDKIQNEQDFAVFFEENKKKLSSFLEERKNSLNNYKDKMSGEF